MSVLQIVKGLIGEADVNWGDSDTTFSRQTHTGGAVNVAYIDSKSIPANTLGGHVDDHLHTQNTDTGTTQTSFIIDSGGDYAKLDTTGLTGDRTYTFPDASQALVGATELASVANTEGASMVGVEDTGGNFTATDVEAALAELAADVSGESSYRGYKHGFTLGYSSVTTITIAGGMWDHRGTTTQAVYTASQVSFVCGSGGSNAGSDDLNADTLHYIYVDDSAVVTAGTSLLTASEFINETTAPAYSHSKAGWYNGNDRCIGAILTSGASQVLEFFVLGSNTYYYNSQIEEFASAAAPTSYAALDISSSVPVFARRAQVALTSATADRRYDFRVTGAGGAMDSCTISTATGIESLDLALTAAQVVYWLVSAASDATVDIQAYYIDGL